MRKIASAFAMTLFIIRPLSADELQADRAEITAVPARNPICIDGNPEPAEWNGSPSWSFTLCDRYHRFPEKTRKRLEQQKWEKGEIRLKYDRNYLYLAGTMEDSDIVQYSSGNQQHLYASGDVVEIFLTPEGRNCYFEIHLAPNSAKSSFFFASKFYPGADRPEFLFRDFPFKARISGTLNNNKDKDHEWTFEAALPLKEIAERTQCGFGAGSRWRILATRWNWGASFIFRQRGSVPKMPEPDFHDTTLYAKLIFAGGMPGNRKDGVK